MPAPIRRRAKHDPSLQPTGDDIVDHALYRLQRELAIQGAALNSQATLHNFLRLWLAPEPREVMTGLFLDSAGRLIRAEIMFQGGSRAVHVSPRVLIQRCLELNATALVIAHNHPNGIARPSRADLEMTDKVRQACDLFEIRLIDSLIVGGGSDLQIASALKRNPQPENRP